MARLFTRHEKLRVAEACPPGRERAIGELLIDSSLKVSELCTLTRRDIDLQSRPPKILGKGPDSVDIPLSRRAAQQLLYYLATCQDDNDALFLSEWNRPLSIRRVQEAVSNAGNRVGLRRLKTEMLRSPVLKRVPREAFEDELLRDLHPRIEPRVASLFEVRKYDLAVFDAMRDVEDRIRKLGGYGNDATGVELAYRAFGTGGALVDPSWTKGEQDGVRNLFAGTLAILRNPAGHHEVTFDDVSEAYDAVHAASLLMRILDRIECRIAGP